MTANRFAVDLFHRRAWYPLAENLTAEQAEIIRAHAVKLHQITRTRGPLA